MRPCTSTPPSTPSLPTSAPSPPREWILRGVPLTTVQAWLGHGSIEVTARYLHHLGDSADRSALQLLNDTAARALSEREWPGSRSA